MKKYYQIFLMGLNEAMQYRLNFVLRLISIVFPVTIQIFIWNSVYSADKGSVVYGFTYGQMIIYTLLSAVVSKFISSQGIEQIINYEIKNGQLNKYTVKPISFLRYMFSVGLGKKIPLMIITSLIMSIILIFAQIKLGVSISILRILFFVISCNLALLLNYFIMFCLVPFAFWINDANSLFIIMTLIINVFSGGVFPLDIFGDVGNRVFDFLPFKYCIYYPVSIINNRIELSYIPQILLLQIVWIMISYFVAKGMWKAGIKTYSAFGG